MNKTFFLLKQEQTIKKDILRIYTRSQTRKKREEDNIISEFATLQYDLIVK